MCYFDVILLSDVISSIGPKISDADTYVLQFAEDLLWCIFMSLFCSLSGYIKYMYTYAFTYTYESYWTPILLRTRI